MNQNIKNFFPTQLEEAKQTKKKSGKKTKQDMQEELDVASMNF